MLFGKIFGRAYFCANKTITARPVKAPKAPRLLAGELQYFKYDFQNARIYDGYTLDQLYGSKVGPKNPPAIQAEMKKQFFLYFRDTFASLLLFGVGVGIIYHLNWLFDQEYNDIKTAQDGKFKRQVNLPKNVVNSFR